jgi:hypothetical protein
MFDPLTWYEFFSEDDEEQFIKKKNRRRKREKIERSKELFQKLNGQGMKSVILPLLEKRSRQERENEND